MIPTIIFIVAILINVALYKLYRRDLASELEATKQRLEVTAAANRNLHSYCGELQWRCERYRQTAITEALAAKMRTEPVVKLYPIQRKNAKFIIESNLN